MSGREIDLYGGNAEPDYGGGDDFGMPSSTSAAEDVRYKELSKLVGTPGSIYWKSQALQQEFAMLAERRQRGSSVASRGGGSEVALDGPEARFEISRTVAQSATRDVLAALTPDEAQGLVAAFDALPYPVQEACFAELSAPPSGAVLANDTAMTLFASQAAGRACLKAWGTEKEARFRVGVLKMRQARLLAGLRATTRDGDLDFIDFMNRAPPRTLALCLMALAQG